MFKHVAYVASLFFDSGTDEQIKYRLDRHVLAIRQAGVGVALGYRFGLAELSLFTGDLEALVKLAGAVAKPGKFAASFVGHWRVAYRQLEAEFSDAKITAFNITNGGNLAECFDDVSLADALRRAEGETPTILFVVENDVEESEILGTFRKVSETTGNKLYYTSDEYIDVHLGDESSQCGATYLRPERQLLISAESVQVLSRCVAALELAPVFGERNWLATRVPTVQARGEVPVDTFSAFSAGVPLELDWFLKAFTEGELSGLS
jgi:hypothetical protein